MELEDVPEDELELAAADESDEPELPEALDELEESPPLLAGTEADDPLRESVR